VKINNITQTDAEQSYIHNYDNSVAVKYGDPNIHFHLRWHCNHKLCSLFEQKNTSIVFQQKLKKNSRWQSLQGQILHKTFAKHQNNVVRFHGLTQPMTIGARIIKSKQCLRSWGTEHYNINRLTDQDCMSNTGVSPHGISINAFKFDFHRCLLLPPLP